MDDGIGAFETVLPGARLPAIPLDGRDGRVTGPLRFFLPSREESDPMSLLAERGT